MPNHENSREGERFNPIESPISLYNGPIEIINRIGRSNASCEATLQWLRGPHVVLDITANQLHPFLGFVGINAVKLPNEQADWPVIASAQSSWSKKEGSKCTFQATFTGAVSRGNGTRLTKATCQVVNFPKLDFFRTGENTIGDFKEFLLQGAGWCFEFAQVENAKEVYDQLQKQGDYAVTHNVTVRRCDGAAFNSEELLDVFHSLFLFLSFVSGRYVNVILLTGWIDQEPFWWHWGSPILDDWISVFSWVDPHHADVIQKLFTQFAALWARGDWQTTLRDVVHWYVASNKNVALLETSLVLSQNCLDLLAWDTLVQHHKKLSESTYKSMRVDERIRQLLSHFGIPIIIPPEMTGLCELANCLAWEDLPKAISEMRHSIVHPDNKSREAIRKASGNVYRDAWLCAQWILELSLLKILDFNGVYGDRRRQSRAAGDASNVPWPITDLEPAP